MSRKIKKYKGNTLLYTVVPMRDFICQIVAQMLFCVNFTHVAARIGTRKLPQQVTREKDRQSLECSS